MALTALTACVNEKIWFDAKQAVGPLPVIPLYQQSGFNSSIKIMGYSTVRCGDT